MGIWKHPYFWAGSVRGGFIFSNFFILLPTKRVNVVKQGITVKAVGWHCVLHRFQRYHIAIEA
jgi:hypothetical protein